MIYLYAIADGVSDVGGMQGLHDEPLVVLPVGGCSLIGGEIAAAPTISRDSLARQDAVVRALHERAPALLPMRFGATFSTADEVARAISLQQPDLIERLARVRHRDQMTLRISGVDAARSAPLSGAAYLRQRARPAAIAPFLDTTAPLVRATHVEHSKAPGVISVYHLIDRGRSDEYRALIASADESAGMKVHVSGPSPCYAFT